ncbi:MAG: hypothetical protein LBO69_02955 [Ignavibacteria bacterium]|nr:hypothetical protein [Ignavibacteria bacterium]
MIKQFILEGTKRNGYYFFGNIGVGKTTLITGIARILTAFLTSPMQYMPMPKLLKLLTSIEREDKDKIERFERLPLLVVDDFGLERFTTDNQEALARDFFSYRYGNLHTTFICGNADVRKFQTKNMFYRQISDYLNDAEAYKVFEIKGQSRRK